MGRFLAHDSHEVPVFDSRSAVSEHVTDQLRINFACRVETDRRLNVLVVNVAVDGARDHDHFGFYFMC